MIPVRYGTSIKDVSQILAILFMAFIFSVKAVRPGGKARILTDQSPNRSISTFFAIPA